MSDALLVLGVLVGTLALGLIVGWLVVRYLVR